MFKGIAIVLTLLFFYMIVSDVVSTVTKKGSNSERLECHTKQTTFEYVYKKELVSDIQNAIKSGTVEIKSKFKLSEHMQTQLEKHINLEQVDEMIEKQINLHQGKSKSTHPLVIDYFIYENDKEDPGKKTAKSKLYAGYLVFNFMLEGEQIYRLQIDFMDLQGKDIEEKIQCMMKSVLTLKIQNKSKDNK